jgi:hypothetical protein
MCPPEWIGACDLILLELLTDTPSSIISQGMAILLEQCVDTWDTSVPAVIQIIQRQPPVLSFSFLFLERILAPYTLTVNELALPRLNVTVEVWNQLLLLVSHTCPEVSHTQVGLLTVPQVRLGDQDMSHAEHTQTTNFLGRIEDYWRESGRHLGVEANLDTCLNLVLTFDQQIQQLLQ